MCAVHFSFDPRCNPGDSRGLQVPAAPTCRRLSSRQRRRLPGQSRCTLEPRHRHRESSQNGRVGAGRGKWRASGKLKTKERAGGSEAQIASERVIKMESDREKGRECRAILLPLPADISAQSSLKNPGPHYHKTTSFIKAYPVHHLINRQHALQ